MTSLRVLLFKLVKFSFLSFNTYNQIASLSNKKLFLQGEGCHTFCKFFLEYFSHRKLARIIKKNSWTIFLDKFLIFSIFVLLCFLFFSIHIYSHTQTFFLNHLRIHCIYHSLILRCLFPRNMLISSCNHNTGNSGNLTLV